MHPHNLRFGDKGLEPVQSRGAQLCVPRLFFGVYMLLTNIHRRGAEALRMQQRKPDFSKIDRNAEVFPPYSQDMQIAMN